MERLCARATDLVDRLILVAPDAKVRDAWISAIKAAVKDRELAVTAVRSSYILAMQQGK